MIAVLDYGMGNLRSVARALERAGGRVVVTGEPAVAHRADALVVPGVGAFGACMDALRASRLEQPALEAAASGRPFLGICVGMQMLFDASEEDPGARGLGIIPGDVRWLVTDLTRPQMQWNQLVVAPGHVSDPMFADIGPAPWVYFVYSLHGVTAE